MFALLFTLNVINHIFSSIMQHIFQNYFFKVVSVISTFIVKVMNEIIDRIKENENFARNLVKRSGEQLSC